MKNLKKYLLWFANDHVDFRLSEVDAIVSVLKTNIKWEEKPSHKQFCVVELLSEEVAKEIAKRSFTLKHITELYASSTKIEDLHIQLKQLSKDVLQHQTELLNASFKFNIELFCNNQSYAEKLSRIESFNYLPFRGSVNLNNPDIVLQYFEFYGTNPNNVPKNPSYVFFGKLVANSQRKMIHNLSLKNRKFIGNTSMDAELSLIMANHAKVTNGCLVYDPFVGTGSLLVAAAFFGGFVFGVDIDYLMIHGKTKPTRIQNRNEARKDESVLANMKQYGFENQYIDVVVGDSSLPFWKNNLQLDAIITDPPYGIREAAEKIKKEVRCKRKEKTSEIKYPAKTHYTFHQILRDLLCFSVLHLKLGGRLVTWIPVFRDDYTEYDYLPNHACLSLVSNCEQILSRVISRRLLTFEKIKEPANEELESYRILETNFRKRYFSYRNKRCSEM